MKQDDLTRIKHVGTFRMKLLNDLGIMTIKKLCEMPLEELAAIKSIGAHHAKLIKASADEICVGKKEKLPAGTVSAKKSNITPVDRDLWKMVKRVSKNLNRANEKLKPLWKKKYLPLYVELKKRSAQLKIRLKALNKTQQDLPKKVKKKIIKKADVLNLLLKNVGKKPKKKKYKKVIQEVQSFSKMIAGFLS